jgi:hypothetical protein
MESQLANITYPLPGLLLSCKAISSEAKEEMLRNAKMNFERNVIRYLHDCSHVLTVSEQRNASQPFKCLTRLSLRIWQATPLQRTGGSIHMDPREQCANPTLYHDLDTPITIWAFERNHEY